VTRSEAPEIQWRAVLVGGAVALGAALLLFYMGGPRLNVVAGLVAVAAGALVAGRLARVAGGLHGGLVGALWIAAEALSDPLFTGPADVVGDTALTVVLDVTRLGLGVGAGWLGARLR
jgi:uncharacterized membrane protein YccC